MNDMATIEIPVTSEAAAALADADRRAALGRYVSRMLLGAKTRDLLAEAIAEAKTEARAAGLTDAAIDAELAAYAEYSYRDSGDVCGADRCGLAVACASLRSCRRHLVGPRRQAHAHRTGDRLRPQPAPFAHQTESPAL